MIWFEEPVQSFISPFVTKIAGCSKLLDVQNCWMFKTGLQSLFDSKAMLRSTGKASKLRRDQINSEIETLRLLLPLPTAVKARLSYLQVMSLACVYIRTGNFFSSHTKACMVGNGSESDITRPSGQTSTLATVEITQALPGFLLLVRPSGKILHVSENVIDYLGHSMVEILSGGGDVYDLVDVVDHMTLQTHLEASSDRNACSLRSSRYSFVCQMIMSRSLRRRMPFQGTESKAFHIDGRFHYSEGDFESGGEEGVFLALCTPVDTSMKSTIPHADMVASSTDGFTTKHWLDMRIIDSCNRAPLLLGYSSEELYGHSWYRLIRPEYIFIAQNFHQQILAMTETSDSYCSSTLQLVTKDNQTIYTQITARLTHVTRENSGPVLYTISCEYHIIRGDIGTGHLYQNILSADQLATDSSIHPNGAGSWPYYIEEDQGIEGGRHYTSSDGRRNSHYNNGELSYPLAAGMLGGLPQKRYVSNSLDLECHYERRPHGRASTPIHRIKSEILSDFSPEEPCQHRGIPPGTDVRYIKSPPHAQGKMRIKNYRTARERPYPNMVAGQPMNNGNPYGGYLGRLQGTLDLTYVFGQQDSYRAHGAICLLSSRCSLTELRQRPDGITAITNNTTEAAKGRPFAEHERQPLVTSGVSNGVFDTSCPRPYDAQPSCHLNSDEPRIRTGSSSSRPSMKSTDSRWLTMGPDNRIPSMNPPDIIWPSKSSRSNLTLRRQRSRSASDVSPVEIFNYRTGLGENGERNERCHSRPGSFGMRSVEESVIAALKCLSNDQIKLLDQATWELSETVPCS